MVKKAEKIARDTRSAIEKWRAYFQHNITQYHHMFDFVLGKQWTEEESDVFKSFKKVPLQFNKLGTLVNTLLGEQQQNTPQLEVVPLTGADQETAQIREMVVKNIMLGDETKTVYQVAATQAFIGGFGAFVIDTEYTHPRSFDQDIVYRHLKDATNAYFDIAAERVDKTDGMRSGYTVRISRAKFRQEYGTKVEENIRASGSTGASQEEIAQATDSSSSSDGSYNWADDDGITIIHDYKRKYVPDTLYKLSNGDVVNQEEMDEIVEISRQKAELLRNQAEMMGEDAESFVESFTEENEEDEDFITLYVQDEPVRIDDKRKIKKSVIMHRKIAGDYILDETEFASEDLPVIFMDQNSYYAKDGKQMCRPFVQDAVDAQRYLNYLGTQSAYILKISRYDQFIGSKKNVQSNDTARNWRDPANVKGMLTYDESPSGAKPEQIRPPELSQSLLQQYQRAMDDMYTSTGLYPTRLGQAGNEVSGAAIDARTRQGSYSTYVAFNSVNRAISAGGRIVNQMVPRVYDSERVLTLMTPDRGRQNVVINQQVDEYGELIKNDLRNGTFEVRLQAGPSYEGQKQQALDSLNMVIQSNPSLFNMFADLYAENLPLTNTIEIKNRLKTIVPKEVVEAGKTGEMPEQSQTPSPQDQAAIAQVQIKQQEIEIKKQELALKMKEAETKNEIALYELEMKQLEAMSKLEAEKLRYLAETDRTASDNAIAHANNLTDIITTKWEQS